MKRKTLKDYVETEAALTKKAWAGVEKWVKQSDGKSIFDTLHNYFIPFAMKERQRNLSVELEIVRDLNYDTVIVRSTFEGMPKRLFEKIEKRQSPRGRYWLNFNVWEYGKRKRMDAIFACHPSLVDGTKILFAFKKIFARIEEATNELREEE